MKSKPLTYNRFRAYLRFKFIHQHWNKYFNTKTAILSYMLYFLCSLTLFLLPQDILTKYPYLKHFTDFMDFIPAIKLMESKTYAPELCKFYASYMFVVGIVMFAWLFACSFYIACREGLFSVYHHTKEVAEVASYLTGRSKKFIAFTIIAAPLMFGYYTYDFLSGGLVGYTKRESYSDFFIDNWFEMLIYIDFWQGVMLCFGLPYGLFIYARSFYITFIKGAK